MPQAITLLGVHPIAGPEPVHLIELQIIGSTSPFNIGSITQEIPGETRSNWQVPFGERVLDATGTIILADPFLQRDIPTLWQGDVQIAFFFHYLDLSHPLTTDLGPISLHPPTPMPARLSMMRYEPPD